MTGQIFDTTAPTLPSETWLDIPPDASVRWQALELPHSKVQVLSSVGAVARKLLAYARLTNLTRFIYERLKLNEFARLSPFRRSAGRGVFPVAAVEN